MMCLGWNNKTTCKTRPQVDVATGQTVDGTNVVKDCEGIGWFWFGLLAIGVGGLMKK